MAFFLLPFLVAAGCGASAYAGYKTAEVIVKKVEDKKARELAGVASKTISPLPNVEVKKLPTKCGGSRGKIIQEIGEETKGSSTINLPEETYEKIQENIEKINNRLDKREKLKLLDQIKTATPEERETARKELLTQTQAE